MKLNHKTGTLHTESEPKKVLTEEEKCAKRRKVKSCDVCCHNKYCFGDGLKEETTIGEIRLGLAIIYGATEEYESDWKHARKNKLAWLNNWFRSQMPTILSAEKIDGVALVEALEKRMIKKYGDFETIYQKFQAKHKKILKELNAKLKLADTPKERKALRKEILKERGLLNQ